MKIKFAKLHEVIFVPDIGNMGPTLQDNGFGGKAGVKEMTFDTEKNLLTVLTGTGVAILIPSTSITHMAAAKEQPQQVLQATLDTGIVAMPPNTLTTQG